MSNAGGGSFDEFEIRNHVLLSLRPSARGFLAKRMMTRRIFPGEVIYEDGAPFTHAVFPHEGLISLMAEMGNGRSVEKTSIGLEGFLGFVLLMGGGNAISRSVVLVPGYASWLSVADLDEALGQFECVRQTMLRYAKALISHLMESVACNSLHSAEQRVSRWLLHSHDRVRGDSIAVTQQAVADALGMRRATVSEVCSRLLASGIVEYSRGVLLVLDRPALERRSCECYRRIVRNSLAAG